MRKLTLFLLLSLSIFSLSAKDIVITNPVFEVKNSGITNISKIELTSRDTRVHVHCTFLPNWWEKFEKPFIQNSETGERFYATAMEGGEFDKEIYMPASGDSTFVLIFPKLESSIKKIDYGNSDRLQVFGISLDPQTKAELMKTTPSGALFTWIMTELIKAKRSTLVNLESDEFFSKEPARLVGYIRGYDPRLGFTTGIVYSRNEITNEDFPTVIEIHEDGRFEATLPMNYPKYTCFSINGRLIDIYIEPGQTLGVILDWEEFLVADRRRDIRYKFKDIEYMGPLAQVNNELAYVDSKLEKAPYMNVYKEESKKMKPDEYKAYQEEYSRKYRAELEELLQNEKLLPQTKAILKANSQIEYATYLLEYGSSYNYQRYNDPSLPPIPSSFYDFLQDMSLNDQRLLTSPQFSVFINRLEFLDVFRPSYRAQYQPQPEKGFEEYLFDELQLKKTAEDTDYFAFLDSLSAIYSNNKVTEAESNLLKEEYKKKDEAFNERYKEQMAQYQKKYIDVLEMKSMEQMTLEEWKIKDSVYTDQLKLQPSIIYDIMKVRSLDFSFKDRFKKKDEARSFLTQFEDEISNQFLKDEAERLYHKNYPTELIAAYDLPESKGTDVIRKIIDPFKGKLLFIDFWGIFCGPCVHGIKERKPAREKYKGNPDFEFLFITSVDESPLDRYNAFVKEQDLEHTYRLSADDFKYLRQLFKFNGIPRYVVIDKDGRVLNDDFGMHNFESVLPELLKKGDSGDTTDLSEK